MFLQEKWKDFMKEMGLEDMSDPMEELPTEVMLYSDPIRPFQWTDWKF